MGTDKRARQKANRQSRLVEVEREQTREKRESSTKRYGFIAAIILGIIALFVLFSVLTGGDDDENGINFADEPEVADAEPVVAATAVPLVDSVPADFAPFAGDRALAAVVPTARNEAYDSAPPMLIDESKQYAAILNTDAGTIRLELFADAAPLTVNNFVALARDGFYDGISFHRVIEDFMAQGGDPLGTGVGGPGYRFADEFDPELAFDRPGLLAMANSGPATNGSQFFITFTETPSLTGVHTIFGELVGDISVLDNIVRSDSGGATIIDSVNIIEG